MSQETLHNNQDLQQIKNLLRAESKPKLKNVEEQRSWRLMLNLKHKKIHSKLT